MSVLLGDRPPLGTSNDWCCIEEELNVTSLRASRTAACITDVGYVCRDDTAGHICQPTVQCCNFQLRATIHENRHYKISAAIEPISPYPHLQSVSTRILQSSEI